MVRTGARWGCRRPKRARPACVVEKGLQEGHEGLGIDKGEAQRGAVVVTKGHHVDRQIVIDAELGHEAAEGRLAAGGGHGRERARRGGPPRACLRLRKDIKRPMLDCSNNAVGVAAGSKRRTVAPEVPTSRQARTKESQEFFRVTRNQLGIGERAVEVDARILWIAA